MRRPTVRAVAALQGPWGPVPPQMKLCPPFRLATKYALLRPVPVGPPHTLLATPLPPSHQRLEPPLGTRAVTRADVHMHACTCNFIDTTAAIDIGLLSTADGELSDDRCCCFCSRLLVLIHDAVEWRCA